MEIFSKETVAKKKNQGGSFRMRNIVTEIKHSLKIFSSRIEMTEERVNLKTGKQKISNLRNRGGKIMK